MKGFLMLDREAAANLIKVRPSAFLLLTQIALRARRKEQNTYDGLEIGEALIGDHKWYGATRSEYRTDINTLKNSHLIAIRLTTRGTIVKLLSNEVFDINPESERPADGQKLAIKSPTNDQRIATNNNVIKKERNNKGGNELFLNPTRYEKKKGVNKDKEWDKILNRLRGGKKK